MDNKLKLATMIEVFEGAQDLMLNFGYNKDSTDRSLINIIKQSALDLPIDVQSTYNANDVYKSCCDSMQYLADDCLATIWNHLLAKDHIQINVVFDGLEYAVEGFENRKDVNAKVIYNHISKVILILKDYLENNIDWNSNPEWLIKND